MLSNKKQEDYTKVKNLINVSDFAPSKKNLELDLSRLIPDEEEDDKIIAEEIKDHKDKERLENLDLFTEEVKTKKKSKASIDQCAWILTDVFSTIPMEEKHEKLKVLIEECDVGNDEGYEDNLKGLFQAQNLSETQ